MSTLVESKRLHLTSSAYQLITEAHTRLKLAGAVDAAARVKACLNSVRGAVRHATSLNHLGDEDLELRKRRRKPKHTYEAITKAPSILKLVQMELSGHHWGPETCDRIAAILRANGITVKDAE